MISFQMLLEMRILAADKKQKQKLNQNCEIDTKEYNDTSMRKPLLPQSMRHRFPVRSDVHEENSLTSKDSKYLLPMDTIMRMSQKADSKVVHNHL